MHTGMQERKTLLETSRFRVTYREWTGPEGEVHGRETIQHPGSVTILPCLDDGRVCLIRNYRVAVDETLVELPAGTLEPGEEPRVTALRELQEETGFQAGNMQLLARLRLAPGVLNEFSWVFLATELRTGAPDLQAGECIENLIVTWDEALKLIDSGQVTDAKTVAAILFYDRRRNASETVNTDPFTL